ncbi:MAG: S9 family peptidase [Acidobacteriia bacterium]|nr:S9 family peptidase [Terriglobia bacterium]
MTSIFLRTGKVFLAAAALLGLAALPVLPQTPRSRTAHPAAPKPAPAVPGPLREVMESFSAAHTFQQVAISPDASKVTWVEDLTGADGAPTGDTAIYLRVLGLNKPAVRVDSGVKTGKIVGGRELPFSAADGSVAWAPDSKRLVFLSDAAKKGQLELYLREAPDKRPRRLTNVTGFLSSPAWSPDGKTIAVLFTENATRAAGPLVAETPQTGEIKEAVTEQRLALVDAATGNLRQISPADMYVYEFDWSPDGQRFVVTAAHDNGDNNWYIARLYTLDAGTGAMKSIYQPPLQIANPAWSPDGKRIAFIAGLMSDEPSVGGDIFTISAEGGEAKNVTPEMKASASWLRWTPEGKILFGETVGGDAGFATVDPSSEKMETLWSGTGTITTGDWSTSLSLSADGKTSAVLRHSYSSAPEVYVGAIGAWKPLTERNAAIHPGWGEAKSIHWKSDGYDVQGWLIYPRHFDAAKKYPMVVHVHGGPGAAVHSHWPGWHDFPVALAGAGYFVLEPNPRGSFGQGEAFTRANVKDFGYGDFRDIMAGVDEAIRIAPIDPQRLGITGWSYGGYMTMWAVTQSNRFKAAVSGAGLSNWQSYYGENLIDQWMIPFFGASVYDDPAVYAKSSPMNFIKNVKTPTLILVGDSDGEVPAPQSWEFWHALKTLGVETKLVVYEHEGHAFAKPEHQRDLILRSFEWFNAHLK